MRVLTAPVFVAYLVVAGPLILVHLALMGWIEHVMLRAGDKVELTQVDAALTLVLTILTLSLFAAAFRVSTSPLPSWRFASHPARGGGNWTPIYAQHSSSTAAPSARPLVPKAERVGRRSGLKYSR